MKRTLTILAGLLLAASVQAANYQAAAAGDWHATNTWGVTSIPGASDHVDLNGKAVTLTNSLTLASLVDVATGGSLDLGANVTFTCRAVTNAALSTSAEGVVVDCDYTLTALIDGFMINYGGEATIAGTWNNSGSGYAVYSSGGTVTDFSGTMNNSGSGGGVAAAVGGQIDDISGVVNNSSSGSGVHCGGIMGATLGGMSGVVNNSGSGYGIRIELDEVHVTDIDGEVINSGSGIGVSITGAVVADISGTILDYGSGIALFSVDADISTITGIVGRPSSQPDLAAENVKSGKTILGVTGTMASGGSGYGINGTGLLGASW
jgi:hypothetical protein